jgi:putative 4-mercaptohistidine N1-methyltranferase
MDYYESDRGLAEYLLFHYGTESQISPPPGARDALDYPKRCVRELLDVSALPCNARALDVGCAVGRSSFEFARYCRDVVGLDYSQRFIDSANRLKAEGRVTTDIAVEGFRTERVTFELPSDIDRSRVTFAQADAHALPPELGRFEVVLAANLIDRLAQPQRFLNLLPSLIKPGGQLILTSPYTWLEDYTPREHWLATEEHDTLTGLKQALAGQFTLTGTRELPFLLREHARKFQWSVAQASLWQRVG